MTQAWGMEVDAIPADSAILERMHEPKITYYCPKCAKPVDKPLSCGDCGSLICRECGTPLENSDDLGLG